MRIHFLHSLVISCIVATSCLAPATSIVSAAPMNTLVKGSSSTVYYADAEGNRYFFPNESVYKSWYPSFANIPTISDSALAELQLRGNVFYRPGTVLIKITTDPKVYAVSRYGVLRWLTNETLAKIYYGEAWNKQVVDVSDAYFANYLVGDPIQNLTDFSVAQEITAVPILQNNLRPATFHLPSNASANSTPTATAPDIAIDLSTSQAVLNQSVSVIVTVTHASSAITKIEVHSDETPGALNTCMNTAICSYEFTVKSAPLLVHYSAQVTDTQGKTYSVPMANRPLLSVSSASDQVQLAVGVQTLPMGSKSGFTSSADKTIPTITSHKIYALIPGEPLPVLWKDCGTSNPCASSSPFYRTTSLYSDVVTGGQHFLSKPIVITVVGGEAPKPTLTVLSHPSPNHVELKIHPPSGEMILATTIVDGPTINDPPLAMCDGDCTITVEIKKQSGITAFTWVGGKYERSNTVTVLP